MVYASLGNRPDPLGKALHIVIIGSQRSGTNLLREVLNTNPGIGLLGEVLLPQPVPTCWHHFVRNFATGPVPPGTEGEAIALMDDYLYFLEYEIGGSSWSNPDGRRKTAIGFDVKYNQLRFIAPIARDLRQPPFLLDYFRLRNFRILHMVRKNVVQLAISAIIANDRQLWHNWRGEVVAGQHTVNTDELLSFARWAVEERAAFRQVSCGLDIFECEYEDLVDELQSADTAGHFPGDSSLLREMATFIGVPPDFNRPTRLAKAINRPYSEILSNHNEVLEALKVSEFAAFANDLLPRG